MSEHRLHGIRAASTVVLLVSACAPPELSETDVAAIQLAVATEIVASIAANPGSIVTICVGYEGDGAAPDLPASGSSAPAVVGVDGCEEREGRLTTVNGQGQAISVRVRVPEPVGRLRANAQVFTSTGGGDLAAYTCETRQRDGAWRSDGCGLDAIS